MLKKLNPQEIKQLICRENYDYLDFGCSNGGSLKFGKSYLGGTKGLGVDINPDKVRQALENDLSAVVADVTELSQLDNVVRFVTLFHFLEHLSGFSAARNCLDAAITASSDFVLVRQPCFESDGYLFERGLKLYWSDWTGHPYAMTTLDFYKIIRGNPKVKAWGVYGRKPISHSKDLAIHPLASPRNQHAYDPAQHPAKPMLPLSANLFYELVVFIQTGNFDLTTLRGVMNIDHVIYETENLAFLNRPLAKVFKTPIVKLINTKFVQTISSLAKGSLF
ncbi:class I SAM-dependent methyltransferase [Dactylococcopsis salina]|uniref:Methyltransferase family protein n=1 Tax=Dactylococcopsis salina (strain PCC 8305) TaxID=13035 RepID=K9YU63_DACS8|nr:class I SAM-dependent methyltransferase [Dactylococcopsis salina]AFZ50434.1 methyltransferase family protein [Dactylococcopsis salina PCC 8305]